MLSLYEIFRPPYKFTCYLNSNFSWSSTIAPSLAIKNPCPTYHRNFQWTWGWHGYFVKQHIINELLRYIGHNGHYLHHKEILIINLPSMVMLSGYQVKEWCSENSEEALYEFSLLNNPNNNCLLQPNVLNVKYLANKMAYPQWLS